MDPKVRMLLPEDQEELLALVETQKMFQAQQSADTGEKDKNALKAKLKKNLMDKIGDRMN